MGGEPTAATPRFSCLVLEDDPGCAAVVSEVIRGEGGETTVCPTVAEARRVLGQRDFDLFVLDHGLPDGTGTAFYYELRNQGILATAIMLTGLPELQTAVELTRSGLFDYLTKPIRLEQLVACLRRVLPIITYREADESVLDFVGSSVASKEVRRLVQRAADNPAASVLLTGATGVGKDLTARMVHQLTFARQHPQPPFVSLNCSNLPAEMFEAELFGAEKGAYTGAHQQRLGLAEAARGGTLFLDEIGEVPLLLQSKLLQFLETREYRRLGSTTTLSFAGRIIAASNKSLEEEVRQGHFRADLWYRLDVLSIHLAPLRERREDLPVLTETLLRKLCQKYQRQRPNLQPAEFTLLAEYDFPGNVRELRNLLERSLLQTSPESNWLELDRNWLKRTREKIALAVSTTPVNLPPDRELTSLEAQEYGLIQKTLRDENGVIRRAAAKLGLSHQALLRRLTKWPELRSPR